MFVSSVDGDVYIVMPMVELDVLADKAIKVDTRQR